MYIVLSVVTATPPGVIPFSKAHPDVMGRIHQIMDTVPGVSRILRERIDDVDTIVNVYFNSYEDLNNWLDRVWTIPEFIHRYDYNITHGIARNSTISEVVEIPNDPKFDVLK